MTLDQMNMETFQSIGGYINKKGKGNKKNKPRSLRLLSYVRRNRRHTKRQKYLKKRNKHHTKGGNKSKGGSVLADVSVPASLLLLNQFFKNKKTQENKKKKFKKTRKNR